VGTLQVCLTAGQSAAASRWDASAPLTLYRHDENLTGNAVRNENQEGFGRSQSSPDNNPGKT